MQVKTYAMKRTLLVALAAILAAAVACHKQGNPPSHPDTRLIVSVDSSVGMVVESADTFLVRLKDPFSITATPLVYHVAPGARVSPAARRDDSTWTGRVDLSGNRIEEITVDADDHSQKFYVAYYYKIENYPVGVSDAVPNCLHFKGDTLYVGTTDGLYYSMDGGKDFAKSSIWNWGEVDTPRNILAIDDLDKGIWAGSVNYVLLGDGDTLHGALQFGLPGADSVLVTSFSFLGNAIWRDYYANDTLFYGTTRGLFFSFDAEVSVQFNYLLNQGDSINCIATPPGLLLVGTNKGLETSTDYGTKSFTLRSSVGPVYGLAVQGGLIYAAVNGGIAVSSDVGGTFATHNGAYGSNAPPAMKKVAVSGTTVVGASAIGLAVSWDGGVSFDFVAGDATNNNLIPGYEVNDVAFYGNKIYAVVKGNAKSGGGWVSVLTPR